LRRRVLGRNATTRGRITKSHALFSSERCGGQGRLADNGNPANGNYDLQFILRDAATNQVGSTVTLAPVLVTNGLFAVTLDFGANAFDGSARWLEIAVRKNEPPGLPPEFVTLSPRQPVTAAPYAIQAASAAGLMSVGGQPLELKVNGERALRLEPTTDSPNIIGGFGGNYAAPGAVGATIAGGGSAGLSANRVAGSYGTIGGGTDNAIGALSSWAVIAGGAANVVGTNIGSATIAGGEFNEVWSRASTIGGGQQNFIDRGSWSSSIGGGERNRISNGPFATGATIAGGSENGIWTGSSFATIAGGQHNDIHGAGIATIGGGSGNLIVTNAAGATIGGGQDNLVDTNATWATIPGGTLAKATSYGQLAYASGGFSGRYVAGMAQSSLFVLRRETTNSMPTELFLDGGDFPTGGRRMMLPDNGTWLFDAIVIARSSSNDCAGFQIKNMIKNVGGATSLVDVPSVTRFPSDAGTAGWNVTVEGDDANDSLVIKVTGANSTTIYWVASVRTVEVIPR